MFSFLEMIWSYVYAVQFVYMWCARHGKSWLSSRRKTVPSLYQQHLRFIHPLAVGLIPKQLLLKPKRESFCFKHFSGRNARFSAGYRPEDFIGKISVVAASANNSNIEYIALKRFYIGYHGIWISRHFLVWPCSTSIFIWIMWNDSTPFQANVPWCDYWWGQGWNAWDLGEICN